MIVSLGPKLLPIWFFENTIKPRNRIWDGRTDARTDNSIWSPGLSNAPLLGNETKKEQTHWPRDWETQVRSEVNASLESFNPTQPTHKERAEEKRASQINPKRLRSFWVRLTYAQVEGWTKLNWSMRSTTFLSISTRQGVPQPLEGNTEASLMVPGMSP